MTRMHTAFIPALVRGGARPFALVLLLVLFAATGARTGVDPHLFVVSTDYTTSGSASTMSLTAPFTADIDIESVGTDPVVRAHGGFVYVLNRFGDDALQVIDAATGQTVSAFSLDPLSNPQDIVVLAEDRAWVTRLASRWLLLVNPMTGARIDSVDLGGFADADGRPEMSYMALDGDRLFVQIQRLDTDGLFDPVPPSYVAVVDVTANALIDVDPGSAGVQAIELAATNPHQKMPLDAAEGRLYVSEIGTFGNLDGGVEVIDTRAMTSLGMALTEAGAGGDVSTPIVVSETHGYVLVSDDFFATTRLVRFDPSTGTTGATLHVTASFTSGLAHDLATQRLYFADRATAAPGVRVFDTDTDTQVSPGAVSVGLPPADMAVVRPSPVDVAGGGGAPSVPPAYAAPNPFVGRTALALPVPARGGARVVVDLFDASGRRVRTFDAVEKNGFVRVSWDGTDGAGRRASPGTYLYRARGDGRAAAAGGRVVLVR